MKSLSRILTVCLCCVPAFGAGAAPVATTAGSNLTAFNPNNAYNNQWATMSNGRYDGNGTARVDFGNCNAVVLRCAQPKCGNGGCTDENVAAAIVSGCVKSNNQCKQYGDDLVEYMTAQLVASSNAKINQQQMALQQAKIQAEAAATASAQSEQISQMQNQMYQMQQQMAQQQEESAAALREALAQQSAQSAAALEDMRSAATDAAKQTEAGITAYQQEAINRGISEDVLARQQITGQIITQIEDAETSLTAMKKALQNSFDYAGCDSRGNNCTGPKRIKKWRELARGFLPQYDNVIDKIYNALDTAKIVGVDLTQIYAMLDDSCNSWAQYLCPGMGAGYYVTYGYMKTSNKDGSVVSEYVQDTPRVCPSGTVKTKVNGLEIEREGTLIIDENTWKNRCRPCNWLKPVTENEDIYAGWVESEKEAKEQQRVVACSSKVLDSNPLFARHSRNKKGKGIVDIVTLDRWLGQTEPNKVKEGTKPEPIDYCGVEPDYDGEKSLEAATLSRTINMKSDYNHKKFCVKWPDSGETAWTNATDEDECPYINPVFAICDTHPFNINFNAEEWANSMKKDASGETSKQTKLSEEQENMHRIIGLKITVVSQQMYKQYEYLNATLRRLKTQLEKAVLTSNLEAAGAKSEDGSSSSGGGLVGGKGDSDREIILAGAENCWNSSSPESAYSCIQNNLNVIKSNASTNKQKAAKQLNRTVAVAKQWGIDVTCLKKENGKSTGADTCAKYNGNNSSFNKDDITACANALSIAVARTISDEKKESNRYSGWGNNQK